jgi:hypothetical protein
MQPEYIKIPLTQGYEAIVDAEDAERVLAHNWHAHVGKRGVYARRNAARIGGKRGVILMHRWIMGLGPGDPEVDHRNHDTLDNRRNNLRACTNSQNQANRSRKTRRTSSRYRGVTLHRRSGRWQAAIRVNGKDFYLGLFNCEEEAAIAYNVAAREHFGDFSALNELETT